MFTRSEPCGTAAMASLTVPPSLKVGSAAVGFPAGFCSVSSKRSLLGPEGASELAVCSTSSADTSLTGSAFAAGSYEPPHATARAVTKLKIQVCEDLIVMGSIIKTTAPVDPRRHGLAAEPVLPCVFGRFAVGGPDGTAISSDADRFR